MMLSGYSKLLRSTSSCAESPGAMRDPGDRDNVERRLTTLLRHRIPHEMMQKDSQVPLEWVLQELSCQKPRSLMKSSTARRAKEAASSTPRATSVPVGATA